MSASLSEQSFQYVGILNGVMYRIDPLSGRSVEPLFGAQPFRKWSDTPVSEASAQIGAAPAAVTTQPALEAAASAEAVSVGRAAAPSTLFPRSGAEPLRAGHPDLWALLVAGTSLEGTAFHAP
jgi:hypothetical protein